MIFFAALRLIADDDLQYNRDVRLILSDKCFACHGPDDEDRQAELRLNVREEAIHAGAIVPGNLIDSLLIDRTCSDDPDQVMPPPSHDQLSSTETATLRQWIESGGDFQLSDALVQAVVLHEIIIERERARVALGNRTRVKNGLVKGCNVPRFYSDVRRSKNGGLNHR